MTDDGPGRAGDPWWASGADRLTPEPDPLAAYRRVRLDRRADAGSGDAARASEAGRTAAPDGDPPTDGWASDDGWRRAIGARDADDPRDGLGALDDGRRPDDRPDEGWRPDDRPREAWRDDVGRDGLRREDGWRPDDGRRTRDRRDVRQGPGVDRSAIEDAVEGIAALLRAAGRRARREGRATRDHDPACRSCPWCTLTRSLGDARPEVTEHLEQAARHLVLAARAWVDAADERTSWQRIPIDDEEQQ